MELAHLTRGFQALVEHPQVKSVGRDLMRPTKELSRHWSRCRDGTITRLGFERRLQPIQFEIDSRLRREVFSGPHKTTWTFGPLYDHRKWLWMPLDVAGVELTNNAKALSASRGDLAKAIVRHANRLSQPLHGDGAADAPLHVDNNLAPASSTSPPSS